MNGTTNIEWVSHPLKEERVAKSITLIVIILFVSIIAHTQFESALFGFVALVLLTASMSRYFFPTRYTIDPTNFTVSHAGMNRTYIWSDFRRAVLHPDGIFVSPFAKKNRLDSFRGQFLRTPHSQEIYNVVQQYIQAGTI